jgi:hypothetical protein
MFTIDVKEDEKVLLYKNEQFVKVLDVGVHKLFHWFRHFKVERIPVAHYGLEAKKSDVMLKLYPEKVAHYFDAVKLTEEEIAYIWIDGNFVEILESGTTKLYFKGYDIRVEKVNIKVQIKVAKEHTVYVDQVRHKEIIKTVIDKNAIGYLFVNERYEEMLDTGKHYFYKKFYDIEVKAIDKRVKELEITGQELLSHDKVTLRCNATMHYRVHEGIRYLESVEKPLEYLYKQMQFALREHIGALEVDAILTKQHSLSHEIIEKLTAICDKVGVTIEAVHIKDIILPGEMREIFNQVIEATKRAEANNIQRREETAATRSLLNTAKLMKDNPALARLKELEALEKITATVGTLNVYGGLDNVMHGLVDLQHSK